MTLEWLLNDSWMTLEWLLNDSCMTLVWLLNDSWMPFECLLLFLKVLVVCWKVFFRQIWWSTESLGRYHGCGWSLVRLQSRGARSISYKSFLSIHFRPNLFYQFLQMCILVKMWFFSTLTEYMAPYCIHFWWICIL